MPLKLDPEGAKILKEMVAKDLQIKRYRANQRQWFTYFNKKIAARVHQMRVLLLRRRKHEVWASEIEALKAIKPQAPRKPENPEVLAAEKARYRARRKEREEREGILNDNNEGQTDGVLQSPSPDPVWEDQAGNDESDVEGGSEANPSEVAPV